GRAAPKMPELSRPRMARVQGPPVQPDIGAETVQFDEPPRRVVTFFARRLEWTEPEFVDVAVVCSDVTANRRQRDDAALQTVLAKRMLEQLMLPDPGQRAVEYPLSHFVGWPRTLIVLTLSSGA